MTDRIGITAGSEGEGFAKNHGPSKPAQWRKVHLDINADNRKVRAIKLTGSWVGDAPILRELLSKILDAEQIDRVSFDAA